MEQPYYDDGGDAVVAPADEGGIITASVRAEGADDDETGPEKLFSILQEAVPPPDSTTLLTPEELQRRRELVEQTWDQVRRWMWAHETQEERAAAAYVRGQADATPLHLMCKLNNPPADVINYIVDAAPDVVSWVDNHGWLPLHHACANGAPPEVIEILTTAYPESKTAQDNQNRTPLHFYATRNVDNPAAMSANVELLTDTGAATLADRGGMLPMHYACAYGTSRPVLRVLAESYPESLTAKESKGRTPMHLAMVNAHRDASPGVIRFLLEGEGRKAVNMRDHDGNLPLHLLALGLKGLNFDEPEKLNNVSECLSLYLAAEPHASPDFLTSLQHFPDWLQDVAVVSPHVQNILNKKIVQSFPTFIRMLDGYMLILLIISFQKTTQDHIDFLYKGEETDTQGYLIILFVGASYFLTRELIQIVSLWNLGDLTPWFFDENNWVDMAVITLVFYYAILMHDPENRDGLDVDQNRSGIAFTKGVLWTAVIYFLKSTLVDFAVFVGGVFYVVQRLVAFLLAVGVFLLAFAQMFFIVYKQQDVCDDSITNEEAEGCNYPHCTFESSLLKVYTMMMGEIGSDTRYDGNLVAQILYVAYAFLVVILLSNVLIAIVTDSYEIIQNDRAAIVFWSNRLDYVAEMDAISSVVRQWMPAYFKDSKHGPAVGAPTEVQEGPNGTTMVSHDDMMKNGSTNYFREGWKQIMVLFESNFYDDIDLNPTNIEFWCYICYQGLALFVVIPVWLALGLATAGWLWPPQVREYLFIQNETAVSRAELERQKLDRLREIQTDIKVLKNEIRKEMAGDRDEVLRMRTELEAVQAEVLSDLQQVKVLMSALLDIGGISQG